MAASTLPRACAFATGALGSRSCSESRPRALTSRRTAVPVLSTPQPASPPPRAHSATPRVHGRRAVLCAAALSAVGALIDRASAAATAPAADGGAQTGAPPAGTAGVWLDDEESRLAARAAMRPAVSLSAFYAMVDRGEVSKVWFIGSASETCLFTTTAAANDDVRRIGEGYPVESSSTQESPLAVVAYVRDRYVLPEIGSCPPPTEA